MDHDEFDTLLKMSLIVAIFFVGMGVARYVYRSSLEKSKMVGEKFNKGEEVLEPMLERRNLDWDKWHSEAVDKYTWTKPTTTDR